MHYFLKNVLYTSLSAYILISCTNADTYSDDDLLARVGNEYLTISEAVEQIPTFLVQQDSTQALHQYQQDWVQSQVLLQEANRLNLADKKEVREKLDKAREEVMKEALKDYIISSKHEEFSVSDNEARSYYQSNKEQFELNEDYVQFRHLKAASIEEAQEAKDQLLKGVPWSEVAQSYDVTPRQTLQESENYWPISIAAGENQAMNHYLNVIGHEEISPIRQVSDNYHFVQLIDTRSKGEHPDLEWLMEEIKEWVSITKRRGHFSSYLNNLYLKAKSNNEVEVFNVTNSDRHQNSPNDTLETNFSND